MCVVCDSEGENVWHVPINCHSSRKCLEVMGLWHTLDGCINQSLGFTGLFFKFANKLPPDRMANLAIVTGSIWGGRNATLWNSINETPDQIVKRARACWVDWNLARLPKRGCSIQEH